MDTRSFKPSVRAAALALSFVVLMASCKREAKAPAETGPNVLAKVGSATITEQDFKEEAKRRAARGHPAVSKEALLDEMVTYQALLERARNAGFPEDPEVKRLFNNILLGRLQEQELEGKLESIDIPEAEIRAAYDSNFERYKSGAKARLAILYRKIVQNPDANAALLEQLNEARRLALSPSADPARGPAALGFAAVAINNSEDQTTRYQGGDIGWIEEGRRGTQWPDAVIDAGLQLAKGEISPVLEAGNGYYVVMKTDERPESVTPLETVRDSIRHRLLISKRAELEEAFKTDSRRLAGIEIFTNHLSNLELPASQPSAAEQSPPILPR